MRKYYLHSAWIVILLFLYPVNLFSQSNTLKNKFSIGIVNWLLDPLYRTNFHGLNYQNLNIDVNISYTGRADNAGFYGGFNDLVPNYSSNIENTLMFPLNFPHTKYLERAKIVRPAYGQRSTYQAEYQTNAFPRYYSS